MTSCEVHRFSLGRICFILKNCVAAPEYSRDHIPPNELMQKAMWGCSTSLGPLQDIVGSDLQHAYVLYEAFKSDLGVEDARDAPAVVEEIHAREQDPNRREGLRQYLIMRCSACMQAAGIPGRSFASGQNRDRSGTIARRLKSTVKNLIRPNIEQESKRGCQRTGANAEPSVPPPSDPYQSASLLTPHGTRSPGASQNYVQTLGLSSSSHQSYGPFPPAMHNGVPPPNMDQLYSSTPAHTSPWLHHQQYQQEFERQAAQPQREPSRAPHPILSPPHAQYLVPQPGAHPLEHENVGPIPVQVPSRPVQMDMQSLVPPFTALVPVNFAPVGWRTPKAHGPEPPIHPIPKF